MMPSRERARRFVRALVGGMTLVVAVTLAGCGTKGGGDSNTASWDHYIQAMDDALTRGDFYAADLARQTAYLLALGSRHWEPMVAVGAAYLRFADSPGARPTVRLEARRIYRSALVRAGEQDSIEGFSIDRAHRLQGNKFRRCECQRNEIDCDGRVVCHSRGAFSRKLLRNKIRQGFGSDPRSGDVVPMRGFFRQEVVL